jgi:hypothetical protein
MCEACSVEPAFSPGPVEAIEILVRFVPALDFDADTRTVKPSLFAHSGTIGMSVTRMNHLDSSELGLQEAARGYVGYVTAPAYDVRNLRSDGERLFAIYDTALPENKAHADICQAVFSQPRSKLSEMRRQLQLVFDRVVSSTR